MHAVPDLPAEARRALDAGRLIDAIRAVRAAEGLGLREAKARVEAAVAAHPGWRARLQPAPRSGVARALPFVVLAALAAAAWWWLGRG